MEASETKQMVRLKGQVPTLDEYWESRLGTSAAYVTSGTGEFSLSSQFPLVVMSCKHMKDISNETNVTIWITNDLVSLEKEMRLDCIDSVVPLTFALTNDIQEAISKSPGALRSSQDRFDQAAKALLSEQAEDERTCQKVESFVEAQKSNCVGNLIWR